MLPDPYSHVDGNWGTRLCVGSSTKPSLHSPPANLSDPLFQLILGHTPILIFVNLVNNDAKITIHTIKSRTSHFTVAKLTPDVSWLLQEVAGRTFAPVLYPGKLRDRTERCDHVRLQGNALLLRDFEVLYELSLRLQNRERFHE